MTDQEYQELIGKFTPVQTIIAALKEGLSEIFYKSRLPNKIVKFTVDLSTARTKKKLSSVGGGEGLFPYEQFYPNWYYLKVLSKGTGTWALRFLIPGKEPIELDNTDFIKGDEVYWEFTELEFTNTAQTGVTNPRFILEKRYF